jgi:hypothetical protein
MQLLTAVGANRQLHQSRWIPRVMGVRKLAGKGRLAGAACTVCNSEHRSRAELLVVGGATQAAVAAKFELSADALQRHMSNHVSEERRASLLVGPVQRMELAARVSEESSSVIDHLRALRAGLPSVSSCRSPKQWRRDTVQSR